MRRSPAYPALGGAVALVAAVAFPAATAAAATDSTTTSVTGNGDVQLAAMEQDLGLSPTQATETLTQGVEAAELEEELSAALGDAFGGAIFDIETGELTVHITDASAAAEVEAAGAGAEVVSHGADALDEVVADLNEVADEADDNVAGWYPDLESDTVVVEVLDGDTAAAEELVAAAEATGAPVVVEEVTAEYDTFQQIVGGSAYYPGSSRCSVGFAVSGGFVTAGHCGGVGVSTSSPNGTVAGSIFPGRDMGWVRSNWTPSPFVTRWQSGGQATVVGSQQASVGSATCRSGSTTGYRCGTIQAFNQTVNYAQGSVTGLTRTSACAEPGDSGGSFIAGTQAAAQAQGVTSGGSGNCTFGGTTFFQPVNPILSQWNLSLTTG